MLKLNQTHSFLLALSLWAVIALPSKATVPLDVEPLIEAYKYVDNDVDKAIAILNTLVKRSPEDCNIYFVLSRAYWQKRNSKEALKAANTAIRLNQTCKPALEHKYRMLVSLKDPRGACAAEEQAFCADPSDDEIILRLRKLYLQLGMDPKHYKESLRQSYLYQGLSCEEKGRSADALKLYNEYIKANPKSQFAYEYRGNCYYFAKQYKKALADYLKAIECYPLGGQSYCSVANCYDALDNVEEAVMYFESSLKLSKSLAFHYKYGSFLVKRQRWVRGLSLYSNIIKGEPDNADAYRQRADCYFGLKKYKDALKDYTLAIDNAVDPSPDTYKQRARVYELLGQPEKAHQDENKAKQFY